MQVRFWGTRGSLPVSMRGDSLELRIQEVLRLSNGKRFKDDEEIARFVRQELPFSLRHGYGGSSSCVEIVTDTEEAVLCDMGSGLREFVQHKLSNKELGKPGVYHFFVSHVHWDHIMGFPFFTPAYIPGNKIVIHGCHDILESALRRQHSDPGFPVDWEYLGADITFAPMQPGETVQVAGLEVSATLQRHHGDSYGYRFDRRGKSVIYSTDGEHQLDEFSAIDRYIDFIRDADLVIFDAMYSLAEMSTVKEDWGHSSNIVGVDLCRRAGVDHYCMFHHEPIYSDNMIDRVLKETIRYEELTREDRVLKVSSAYDGLVLDL